MTRVLSSFAKLSSCTGAIVMLALMCVAGAQQPFKTPEDAAAALANAAKDAWPKGVVTVLGAAGSDIVASGDAVADEANRQKFLAAYDAQHRIAMKGDDKAEIIIGTEDFPFPIPIVHKDGGWQFDTVAGRLEILYRRVGRNELDAIQSCLAYVDAQNEYADKNPAGSGFGTYAQRILSQPGKKDGLYWPTADGQSASPLGELVARATTEGYRVGGGRTPFHGYYYKVLTKQGPSAPGGAMNYVVRGKMIGGFALVAWPAEYGNSGVMTFLVNHSGVVFQKDLGPETAAVVQKMTSFDPDQTWEKADTATVAR